MKKGLGRGVVVRDRRYEICRCGHQEENHKHYRSGRDCSTCGASNCDRYRSGLASWLKRQLLGRAVKRSKRAGRPKLRIVR